MRLRLLIFASLSTLLPLAPGCLAAPRLAARVRTAARAALPDRNLIVNGDFGRGSIGFTSQYRYSPGDVRYGQTFDVTADPHRSHDGAWSMPDHTGNGGQMLVANGPDSGTPVVWRQTVAVAPRTVYGFTAWAANWGYFAGNAASPSILRVSVNGVPVGELATPADRNGLWRRLAARWYSGASRTATLTIVDQTTGVGVGNNFALDDLSLRALPDGGSKVRAAHVYARSNRAPRVPARKLRVGRFQLSTTEGHAFVLDTVTGQVWESDRAAGGSGHTDLGFSGPKVSASPGQ